MKRKSDVFSIIADLPPEWEDMMEKTWIKVPLDPRSAEFNEAMGVFVASDPPHKRVVKVRFRSRYENLHELKEIIYRLDLGPKVQEISKFVFAKNLLLTCKVN